MPLTRRSSHCSMVPVDVIAEAGLASTLPHIRSGRLIGAGAQERISGAGEANVGSLRAPASRRKQAWLRRPTHTRDSSWLSHKSHVNPVRQSVVGQQSPCGRPTAVLWASASGMGCIRPDRPTVPRETRSRIFVRQPPSRAGAHRRSMLAAHCSASSGTSCTIHAGRNVGGYWARRRPVAVMPTTPPECPTSRCSGVAATAIP